MASTPAGVTGSKFFKRYLSDTATYPLFIIIGCAAGLVAFAGSRTLFKHPDVYLSKENRVAVIKDNDQAGKAHVTNYFRSAASKTKDKDIAIFPSLNTALLGKNINPSIRHKDYEEDEDEDEEDLDTAS